ncbi:Daf-16-1 protein 1 [Aphelenchoides besseyi]|nr:Daf-16-1 protein 1 [Aphelenchoides besseyi]
MKRREFFKPQKRCFSTASKLEVKIEGKHRDEKRKLLLLNSTRLTTESATISPSPKTEVLLHSDDPLMSAVHEPLHSKSATILPADFMEPINSIPPSNNMQQPVNYVEGSQLYSGYVSSPNNPSNRTRMQCDDSGIASDGVNAIVPECINSPPLMGFGNEDDFEPQPRDRCNTWPMRRPEPHSTASPRMHDRIPEEEPYFNENGSQTSVFHDQYANYASNGANLQRMDSQDQEVGYDLSPMNYSESNSPDSGADFQSPAQKRSQTRRNAWGNMSYAEMITQAILSSPDQRLTLSQIYDWMTVNIPFFRDKSNCNSSAGWKNSIRHNLSLHSRFMRVQNEGAGKSSWWVINPEAKHGRSPRRRASTMDTNTKQALEKKRRGARKRVEMQMHGSTRVLPQSDQNYEVRDEADDSDYCSTFRSRTLSNISAPGGSQISPVFEPNGEEFKYSWSTQQQTNNAEMNQQSESGTILSELLDRTDQICLDTDFDFSNIAPMDAPQQIGGYQRQQPTLVSPTYVKQEANSFQHSHPYQELNVARGNGQLRNPLLPSQQPRYTQQAPVQQNSGNSYPQQHFPVQPQTSGVYYEQQTSSNYPPNTHGQWTGDRNVIQVQDVQYAQPSMQQSNVYPHGQTSIANNSNLPSDLESINAFDFDVDAILKQDFTSSNSFEM